MKFLFALLVFSSLAQALPAGFQVVYSKSDSSTANKIGTYVSSNDGFLTSSYWIEGDTKLVIIDTQFLLSAAEELIQLAEKTTGKKVGLAIVLHPNPDKYNGTQLFQKKGIKVITSQQVMDKIPSVHELRKSWFFERFKPDYPENAPKLEVFGNKTKEIDFDGLKLNLITMGKGCSDSHVVVTYDTHLFTGDLVTNGFHSWLELGYIKDWLNRVQELKKLEATDIHPGRGASGGPELLDNEEDYLQTVARIFKKYKSKPSEKDLENAQVKIFAAYPAYKYPLFVENGLGAIWKKGETL